MPMVRLFNKKTIKKAHNVDPSRIETTIHDSDNIQAAWHSGIAMQSYHNIDQLSENNEQLIASQIMTSNVVTLKQNDSVTDAIRLLKAKKIRHIPIITKKGTVEGILSERDILHYLSATNEDYTHTKLPARLNEKISHLMKQEVLTASVDTDVRHIARLFVEQHIGAMPIVTDGKIIGLITRSDVLGAVMRYFILELWA
ncbi:hypothetical protein MNBD_GAMMA23-808 [hydrothermal vent metagenome]|uniref:CBS domain-containing protein n=1 Tax=hydrothermal vent metagenome TaxID=652676 RepID=A0A3B1A462_9ZZZZ